jgi:hypothetical protein
MKVVGYTHHTRAANWYNQFKLMIIKRNEGPYFMNIEKYIVLLLHD